MPGQTDDPKHAYVRTQVSSDIHETVKIVSILLRLKVPDAYTWILSRELHGKDPLEYAIDLANDSTILEIDEDLLRRFSE